MLVIQKLQSHFPDLGQHTLRRNILKYVSSSTDIEVHNELQQLSEDDDIA